jgi:hypothetical protein
MVRILKPAKPVDGAIDASLNKHKQNIKLKNKRHEIWQRAFSDNIKAG